MSPEKIGSTRTALIVGGSGAVGKELLRQALADQSWQRIHLLLRHSLGYASHCQPGCHIIENAQLQAGDGGAGRQVPE
jgi:dTDP-D-glucose 4,6-dehydratase